jgi:hypothetical protein
MAMLLDIRHCTPISEATRKKSAITVPEMSTSGEKGLFQQKHSFGGLQKAFAG